MSFTVAEKLEQWGLQSLSNLFQEHQIEVEAFLLLDKESIRSLVPQIRMHVKLEILGTAPSIIQLLEMWPKLLLVHSIDQDFMQIFSKNSSESLCKEFGSIAHHLLLQAKNCGRNEAEQKALSLIEDMEAFSDTTGLIVSTAEVNSALLLLSYLLPQGIVNRKKKFRPTLEQTVKHFIEELPEETSIPEVIASRAEVDRTRTQPFII